MSRLEDAARRYVAARLEFEGAASDATALEALNRIHAAWVDLRTFAFPDAEFED